MRSLIVTCVVVATMVYVNTLTTSLPRKAGRPSLYLPHTKEMVLAIIADNPVMCARIIFARQTVAEMETSHTLEINDIGYSWRDAEKMTKVLEKLHNFEPLTKWEYMTLRDCAGFYWKTLGKVFFRK